MGAFGSILGVAGTVVGAIYGGPAGAAAGGTLGSGIGSALDGADTNKANSDQAMNQMKFQAEMSNTAHQREVEDLKKAGLNPILSVNAGSSTPNGAAAVMQNTSEQVASSAQQAAQLYLQGKQNESQIAKNQTEMNLNNSLAAKAKVDAAVATKGIPEADLKNKVYNKMTPFIDHVLGSTQSAAGARMPDPKYWKNKQPKATGLP